MQEERKLGCDAAEKQGLYNMNSEKVGGCHSDYFGSLHHKIVTNIER